MRKKDGRDIRIRFRVSEEEKEIINERAKMDGSPTRSDYIRKVAQNPTIVSVDYSFLQEHTKQIAKTSEMINRIVFTIAATGTYVHSDIQTVVELIKGLLESENEILEYCRKKRERELRQERRRRAKEKLEENCP